MSNEPVSKCESSKDDVGVSTPVEPVNHGDCLEFLNSYTGDRFDLVYLDPPFFLNREFKLEANSDRAAFQGGWQEHETEETVDLHTNSSSGDDLKQYLSWLAERLRAIRNLMSETGSIFLHIGTREAPYLASVLDETFGFSNWRSTITWQRSHPHNNVTKSLGNVSDYIFYYSKSQKYVFNLLYTAHDPKYLANSFNHQDERGRYALAPIIQERSRKGHFYEHNGVTPPNGWRVKESELIRMVRDGLIHWGSNRPYKKIYLSEAKGAALQNIWTDVHNITRTEVDKRKYPTQKPVKLLERIVLMASNPGDLVFDPFCGSGTTLVAAKMQGRRFLGSDISLDAVEISRDRLAAIDMSTPTMF